MKRLKKLSEETIHANPWWVCKRDTYQRADGEIRDFYYGEHGGMAMVVPKLSDGRIILTLQYRYLGEKQSVEFPGVHIRQGETVAAAAQRCLRDEVGYTADDYMSVGVLYPAIGILKSVCHVFFTEVRETPVRTYTESDDIEPLYRRSDEVEEMIRKNEIWDGQTLAAWALSRHHFLA